MANINLRLYGDQIYPNISKYLSSYISPDIEKENFLEMYKNGLVEIKDIKLKEKLVLHPQINMMEGSIGELKLKIPNETENFSIYLNNMKCSLRISDIKEEEIESILVKNKKNLIDDFIKYSIAKIEKKDGNSFLDNLIKSFLDKILNGLTIDINNLELKLNIDNKENKFFLFKIDNINYDIDKGIKIKGIELIYEDNSIKTNVIQKFDFNIDIIKSEGDKPNKLNLTISDFSFEINKNIYFEFLNYFNLFDHAEYKKIYLKYKKLIQYQSPTSKNDNEVKKNYKLLWKYAIKTVIKLQKYVARNKEDIFDLPQNDQIEIIKKYLDNPDEDKVEDNFLLPDDKNALMATKDKVEKQVLENKKGNVLANAFSFFFGGAKEEEKKELTEEEKETFDEIYTEQSIIDYLNGNLSDNKNDSLNSVFDGVKKFLMNVSIEINIAKLELIIHIVNIGNKQNLFIKGMKMNLNYFNKEFDFNFVINDIGYEKDKSFFDKNDLIDLNSDAITFTRDKNNLISLSFGFKNIELNEDLFMCILIFFKSIKTKKKHKLFHAKKYSNKANVPKEDEDKNKEKENEIIKNIKNFSFMNNFKLSNIPSFSIKNKNNKIEIKVIQYSLTENEISFTVNIKDSYGVILNDFTFNPKRDGNNYIFHMDSPMNIILSNQSTKIFFLNYLRYQKELSNNNNNEKNEIDKNDQMLFGFNYVSYTDIDLGKINMDDYSLDININKINIQIMEEEENYQSSLVIDQFKFLYKNKNLDVNLNKIVITSNLMSTMILYFIDFESPLLSKYLKLVNIKKENVDALNNENNNVNINNNSLEIKNEFNYGKLLKEILKEFNFQINSFIFIFQANSLIMSINLNDIRCFKHKFKEEELICLTINNWNLDMQSSKLGFKTIKVIENNKKTKLKYEIASEIIKGKMESVYWNTNLKEAMEIWENLSFLINQINMDIILCKIEVIVDDFILIFDQFKYTISNMSFSNFIIGSNKNDTFYLKFLEFQMINSSNIKIIYEKELNIDYVMTSSSQNDVIIKCSNDVDIKISQYDISFLIMSIKFPEESEEEIKLLEQNNQNLLPQKNNFDLIKFENKNDNIKKKFTLSVNINVPKLNLCFCLNDNYKKVAEFSIESSIIKSQTVFFEDVSDKRIWSELSYSLLLGKMNFKYFSEENNEISILTKRKINLEDKNGIKEDNKNQVEIICENKGYTVNINRNEVNLRIDSLLSIYYYFKGAIPIDKVIDNLEQIDFKINKDNNKGTNDFQFQINFNDSKFQLNTSLDAKEVLYLDINEFNIIYRCDSNGEIPYGNYMISLNNISTNIASSNNLRYLFSTNKDFLRIKINFSKTLLTSNILLDDLIINLSYTDILSFLKAYSFNMKLYKLSLEKSEEYLKNLELIKQIKDNEKENKEKKVVLKENNRNNLNNFIKRKDIILYSGDFSFKKLDIILIDNSKGSYHPFMDIIVKQINFVLYEDKSFESVFSIYLFSYNYISCVWEPTIEKTLIQINNKSKNENIEKKKITKIILNKLNINLSDMAISFTLLAFNNWLKNLEKEKKKLEDENILSFEQFLTKTGEPKNLSKITNNKVINYTGKEMIIIHNEKEIKCKPLEEVELDYINEYNKSKNSPKHIILIYDENHKFEIPLEKLVILRHSISNDLWIVSENSISENRSINISLYSPIIFRNKSMYTLIIKISNPNKKEEELLVLKPNCTVGLPLSFMHKDTYFNFKLIDVEINDDNKIENDDYSKKYNLDVLNKTEYREKIKFKNKILVMNYDSEITNIRTLVISSEYSIINCLPCDIYFNFKNHDKSIKIDKCSQKYIDNSSNYQSDIFLSINTVNGIFKSRNFNIISLKENEEGNYIEFQDGYYQSFYLLYHLMKNNEENVLVIYAEAIIYNNSELNIDIISSNKDNNLCFGVSKNVYLVSSKIEYKDVSIQLKLINNAFKSKKYSFFDLMEASPYLGVNMINEFGRVLSLNIKKTFSYISIKNNPNFKENIMSMVFSILPCCRITNLLSTQKFLICEKDDLKNIMIINPLKKRAFYFFEKGFDFQFGISVLNLNAKKCSFIIKFQFNRIGIYTLSTDNLTFNIEVRKDPSNGCIDVFIIENNIENSQILLENLTNEGISIFQEKYQKFNQILFPKEKQPLKIYDYESKNFIIQTDNSAKKIILNNMKDKIKINDKIIALVEENKIKKRITFYLLEEFVKLNSSIINNYFKFEFGSIFISIISDNEFQDKKLLNYQRNELLLLVFSKLALTLSVETSTGILNKDFIEIIFNIDDFSIHNQINEDCKFPCILYNTSPFLFFNGVIDFYRSVNIIKLKSKLFQIGKLELGIDPNFFIKLLDFFANILYRMNITNFNVHELFINNKIKEEDRAIALINEYIKTKTLLDARDFVFPEINIKFELSKNELKKLLKEKIGCSKFYIWLAKGLVGSRHRLHLPSSELPFNYGTIGYFFDEILLFLSKQLEDQLTDIGFKGLFGQIKKIKTLFSSEDDNNNHGTIIRIREPRAFYGKFKYFKDFNKDDAILIKNFYKVNSNFKFKYFPLQVINSSKVFFLFTTLSLFCVNKKDYIIKLYIDYFMIKEASSNGKKVLVLYNQTIDSKNSCEFDCENEKISQDITKAINEEIINNKENYLEV